MQVSNITVMKRRNLGNYEHKEVTVSVALSEGDSAEAAMNLADAMVVNALSDKVILIADIKTSTNAKPQVRKEVEAPVKEESKKEETTAEEPPKIPAAATKKKGGAPAVKTTKEDVLNALRNFASAKKSKELAQSVLEDVTGAKDLASVDSKDYAKLIKALAV